MEDRRLMNRTTNLAESGEIGGLRSSTVLSSRPEPTYVPLQ
jgi:hypothetical protein